MPMRLIDFDALWTSGKLSKLQRAEDRRMYLWLFGMADGHHGVFECDALLIWQKSCAFMCPDQTPATIERLLDELERAKLLFRWTGTEPRCRGKVLGFWVGIEKAGRLPPPSKKKKIPVKYEPPPQDALARFLAGDSATNGGTLFAPRVEGFLAGAPPESADPGAMPSYVMGAKQSDGSQVAANGQPGGRVGVGVGGGCGEEKGAGPGGGREARADARPAAANVTSPPVSASAPSSPDVLASLRASAAGGAQPKPGETAPENAEAKKNKSAVHERADNLQGQFKSRPMRYDDAPFLDAGPDVSGKEHRAAGAAPAPLAPPMPAAPPWAAERAGVHEQEFRVWSCVGSVEGVWAAVVRVCSAAPYVSAQLDEARHSGSIEIGDTPPGPRRELRFSLAASGRFCDMQAAGGWWENRRDFFERIAAAVQASAQGEPGPGGAA